MKVIRGKVKKKNFGVPPNIRPTSFRVKKVIFDILREEIPGKHVLDLFAGSGALGIEALSEGAATAVFVDIRRGCINTIVRNLASLKLIGQAVYFVKDAFKAIKDFSRKNERFDIIFLDPPYYKGMAKNALQYIDGYDILAPSGYIVVLCYRKELIDCTFQKISLHREKEYGQTRLLFYKKDEEGNLSGDI